MASWWGAPGFISILPFMIGPRLKYIVWHEPDQVGKRMCWMWWVGWRGLGQGMPPLMSLWLPVRLWWSSENTITRNQESFLNIVKPPSRHRSTYTIYTPSFHWFLFGRKKVMITGHLPLLQGAQEKCILYLLTNHPVCSLIWGWFEWWVPYPVIFLGEFNL